MTAQELFGALVRALGLYWAVYSIQTMLGAVIPAQGYTSGEYVISGFPILLIGIFLMFKADGMVATCYAKDDVGADEA